MNKYQITNRTSGSDLGIYEAANEGEALESLARDAGYRDLDHMAEVIGDDDDLIVNEV